MKNTVTELQTELESVLAWFESDQVNIDEAESQYRRGLELVKQIQIQLEQTKNNITKLKQSFED